MDDHDIINLYWARSQDAISESDRKYGPYCTSIARGILDRVEDAEECVNDTWLRAWNSMPPQRPGILSAFFAKLTRNLSLDRWRRLHAAKRGGSQVELSLEELADCLPDPHRPDEALEASETARIISAFLRGQPELDRKLFVRRYFRMESLPDLARFFHMGEKQLSARLYRTRQKLKLALEKEGIAL